jgi:hypothetical protein
MEERIHYMPFHKVTGISFNNMTCLMSIKIVEISSHIKGHTHTHTQKRSCPLVVSFHIYIWEGGGGGQLKENIA